MLRTQSNSVIVKKQTIAAEFDKLRHLPLKIDTNAPPPNNRVIKSPIKAPRTPAQKI